LGKIEAEQDHRFSVMRDKEHLEKVTAEIQLKEWVNGVMVVACTRLGLK
jgi:hypothetical protein